MKRIHIFSRGHDKPPTIIDNVIFFEEHSTYYIVHTTGEKWFEQVLISKTDYIVFVEE